MKLSHLIILIISIVSVTALQEVSVVQGDSVVFKTIIPSTTYYGMLEETLITYNIPGLNYYNSILNTSAPSNTLVNTIKFDVALGNYTMYITTEANKVVISRDTAIIHVISKQTTQSPSNQATLSLQIVKPDNSIFIPAIPDVNPGNTLVIPVTIRGNGDYELAIPKLSFAIYETPGKFNVNGERTVPILLHISKDAPAGTYTIPVNAGGDQVSVRIRIVKYVQQSYWWFLIPIGLILVILGTILVLARKRKPRRKEDGELITYY